MSPLGTGAFVFEMIPAMPHINHPFSVFERIVPGFSYTHDLNILRRILDPKQSENLQLISVKVINCPVTLASNGYCRHSNLFEQGQKYNGPEDQDQMRSEKSSLKKVGMPERWVKGNGGPNWKLRLID